MSKGGIALDSQFISIGEVSPLELQLDPRNPRFVLPLKEPTQEGIRRHLLEHEGVRALARSIIESAGLRAGERVIVTRENGAYVVLEGNRRVCACQLLLDTSLVPSGCSFLSVSSVPASLKEAISFIPVDIVESRESAADILASRHIEGVKKWQTLAKAKFFVSMLERGKSLTEVRHDTGISEGEIRKDVQDFYLLERALNLPVWTEEERTDKLNVHTIKPAVFTRAFYTDDARRKLRLTFNDETLRPESALSDAVFDKALELVARAAYIGTKKITTRSKITDVPGMVQLFDEIEDMPSSQESDRTEPTPTEQTPTLAPPSDPRPPSEPAEATIRDARFFFEGLACDLDDTDAQGVLVLAREIRQMSIPRYLDQFPNAAAMLMRSLLEQALKYYLKANGHFDKVARAGGDPSLGQLMKYIRAKQERIFPSAQQRELFEMVDGAIKRHLDYVVHQSNLVTMNREIVDGIARSGMRAFIESIINK